MPKIKQKPEDFMVKEVTNIPISKEGRYFYYVLKKRNISTFDAINEISIKLGINKNQIGYAGNKDKIALTEQLISLPIQVRPFKTNKIELVFAGKGDERINLGCLKGNEFIITIRGLSKRIRKFPKTIPNYFGEQRFGISNDTHKIGKALIKKDFKKVALMIDGVVEKDPINQLRKKDKKLLRFYINAYQSYLWNLVVSEIVKKKTRNMKIPLIGLLTEFKNKGIKKRYDKLLVKEGIRQEDFLIRKMPELVSGGSERDLFFEAKNLKTIDYCKDELNNGKFKQVLSFFLKKGSYATIFIKSILFKN